MQAMHYCLTIDAPPEEPPQLDS